MQKRNDGYAYKIRNIQAGGKMLYDNAQRQLFRDHRRKPRPQFDRKTPGEFTFQYKPLQLNRKNRRFRTEEEVSISIKLKTLRFLGKEAELIDKGEVDIILMQGKNTLAE